MGEKSSKPFSFEYFPSLNNSEEFFNKIQAIVCPGHYSSSNERKIALAKAGFFIQSLSCSSCQRHCSLSAMVKEYLDSRSLHPNTHSCGQGWVQSIFSQGYSWIAPKYDMHMEFISVPMHSSPGPFSGRSGGAPKGRKARNRRKRSRKISNAGRECWLRPMKKNSLVWPKRFCGRRPRISGRSASPPGAPNLLL